MNDWRSVAAHVAKGFTCYAEVEGVTAADWEAALAAIRSQGTDLVLMVGGASAPLPDRAAELLLLAETGATELSFAVDSLRYTWCVWEERSLSFAIDNALDSEAAVQALLGFLDLLAQTTVRPVMLNLEGVAEIGCYRADERQFRVAKAPDGSKRW